MPFVKKINPDWAPSENKQLEVGGVIYITDAGDLIRDGIVELVSEAPVQPAPVVKEIKKVEEVARFSCDICGRKLKNKLALSGHKRFAHQVKKEEISLTF